MAMSSLSMMEANLPPGFRFHPRDEELVCDYLTKKISGDSSTIGNLCDVFPTIIDVDLNKCEPWELPEVACVGSKEWYFFNLRDRKYATGQRTNRATESGYWKATGKDRHITRQGMLVGMRKTLVFYEGRAPKGKKTEWVMHEFRMESPEDVSKCYAKEDWVLCRVFYKSRGLISKPSPNSTTNYNEDTSSSSLPPLMESYLTFGHGQTPMTLESYHHHHHHEQVPCFSINPFQNPNLAMAGPLVPTVERSMVIKSQAHDNMDSSLNQLDHDKKVMRDVLYQLTKLEGNQKRDPLLPHLGEGSIGGSFLYDNGLSFMW